MKELEIYIHIPFCVQKCRYCDFLSGPGSEEIGDQYMEALCRELTEQSVFCRGVSVTSVFIGGGTPTCVKPEWIAEVMDILKSRYTLCDGAEISMEMNPGTVDRAALECYYRAGVNRLSIGLQSAERRELAMLGRIHSYEQFLEAYFTAREIGFSNINVDIMSGLPGQSIETYRGTLRQVTELVPAPEHISAYSLIIEEGTPFYREYEAGRLLLPDEDTERQMYELTGAFLQEKGYERYEVSNYARKGMECEHNIGYWIRKNYLGFGIGAASLTDNIRFRNTEDLQQYMKIYGASADDDKESGCGTGSEETQCMHPMMGRAAGEAESLSVSDQMAETMFLGLRMTEGVSLDAFQEMYGMSMEQAYGEVIEKHIRQGLLENTGRYLRLTHKGMDVSNYVMADFLEP